MDISPRSIYRNDDLAMLEIEIPQKDVELIFDLLEGARLVVRDGQGMGGTRRAWTEDEITRMDALLQMMEYYMDGKVHDGIREEWAKGGWTE